MPPPPAPIAGAVPAGKKVKRLAARCAPAPTRVWAPSRAGSRPGETRRTVDWAEWNPAVRPWTVGIEEESMLLEPSGWRLVPCIGDVLGGLSPSLFGHASAETHACVIELATRPHRTVAEAIAELRRLRGLRSAVAGTHPTVVWQDVEISPDPR